MLECLYCGMPIVEARDDSPHDYIHEDGWAHCPPTEATPRYLA